MLFPKQRSAGSSPVSRSLGKFELAVSRRFRAAEWLFATVAAAPSTWMCSQRTEATLRPMASSFVRPACTATTTIQSLRDPRDKSMTSERIERMSPSPPSDHARQTQLFTPEIAPVPGRPTGGTQRLEVIITVKAAPTPSSTYGETVCVAGVSADLSAPGWFRLYPINFRYLEQDKKFKKYDVVSLDATPNDKSDFRAESWRPNIDSLKVVRNLKDWKRRRPWIEPYIDVTMCDLNRTVRDDPHARSLGLVRVADVSGFLIESHPGWTADDQKKIDGYLSQLTLFGDDDRTPLHAPRFRGKYKWRCTDSKCRGHEQGLIDWEFVALQRRLSRDSDEQAMQSLRNKWLDQLCGPANDVSFYVGNQAKHPHTFSVLGVYYPNLKG